MPASLILDLLFPKKCFFCHAYGHYFCSSYPSPLSPDHRPPSPLAGHLSYFKFNGPIRQIIHSIKYDFVTHQLPDLCRLLAKITRQNYPHLFSFWQKNSFVLVPIPLHPFRRRFRGFNQSALIAQSLAPLLHLAYQPDLLIRSRFTRPQVKVSKSARYQTKFIFSLNPNAPIPPNIILFDDVTTTFSTLVSAASTFPPSTSVWSLTIAH